MLVHLFSRCSFRTSRSPFNVGWPDEDRYWKGRGKIIRDLL
ncbi:MAG: hypothetical protein ACI90V_007606, partial [Bacillariaceae sp.]